MREQVARRALCPRCTRPASACICRWITPVASQAHVLILQHPMEVANAKGSARLLHLSIAGSAMMVGEQFSAAELAAALHADGLQPVLLYPDGPGSNAPPAPPLDPARMRLVILDGTWRKSRKMLYQNAALQTLPRLALEDLPPSHYLIRKAHAGHQLSTLEAGCHALARMHADSAPFAPLLAAFDDFVATFQATSGNLRNALEVTDKSP